MQSVAGIVEMKDLALRLNKPLNHARDETVCYQCSSILKQPEEIVSNIVAVFFLFVFFSPGNLCMRA